MPPEAPGRIAAERIATERGIVALDSPSWSRARPLVEALGGAVAAYKVGLELFTAEGPAVLRELTDRRKHVFLDLKLHDIPNTVAGATRSVASLGAELLTVHAAGGREMIRAAVDAAEGRVRVVAVTVLTSLSPEALPASFRHDRPLGEIVLALAEEALEGGAAGVVCSGHEVSAIKSRFGDRCLCVVPGVRPAGGAAQDQARVVTPAAALRDGADRLVIGRTVTQADDPLRAWQALWSEPQP